ncbi:MAG: family 31 glucosidase, partial [Cellulomonas sp.]|nr:family 31 glucosidase [Cellulomonas sp.]
EVVDADWALLPAVDTGTARVEIDGDVARLHHGAITAVLEQTSWFYEPLDRTRFCCRVTFLDAAGQVLLREAARGGSLDLTARRLRPLPGADLQLTATFEAVAGEKLYGMGLYQQAVLDLKGCTLELAHRNSQASVPFVLSSAGYGFLWHNPAIGRATFAANRTEWTSESARQLDYWVTAGPNPAAILRSYADATGHVPMMPERGLGFWQCKLRYWNQAQLLEVAREHVRRGLPLDVIVADFFHWPHMGDYRFEEEFWPDPAAMVAELTELGVDLMVSVWPQVALASENHDHLRKNGLLVRAERGVDVQMMFEGPSVFLDVTDPRARTWLWETLRRNYADYGVRTFWLDEAEPEYGVYDFDAVRLHAGPGSQVGNIYPQAFSRAVWEGQQGDGVGDAVNLVRCAWAGSQRYGALVWSGDIASTWPALRAQITAGLHMGVAGIPWFTTDIGGFHASDSTDPAFHELLVRWFQAGAFMPVMRLHGDRLPYEEVTAADGSRRLRSGGPNELWSFGDEVYEILARFVRLREALRPYLREVMAQAHTEGQPVMRPLFVEFPDDAACWDAADQWLLGADLLVAPVLEPGARARAVLLPAGARWTCLRTGEVLDGGQVVVRDAPLGTLPVFARDGALPELIGRL